MHAPAEEVEKSEPYFRIFALHFLKPSYIISHLSQMTLNLSKSPSYLFSSGIKICGKAINVLFAVGRERSRQRKNSYWLCYALFCQTYLS